MKKLFFLLICMPSVCLGISVVLQRMDSTGIFMLASDGTQAFVPSSQLLSIYQTVPGLTDAQKEAALGAVVGQTMNLTLGSGMLDPTLLTVFIDTTTGIPTDFEVFSPTFTVVISTVITPPVINQGLRKK